MKSKTRARVLVASVLALGLSIAGPAEAVSTVRVKMVDFRFRPRTITIAKGTRVRWVNKGSAPHSTTSSTWDSGLLSTGETFSRRFRRTGTFRYHCTVHPTMTGTIVVT